MASSKIKGITIEIGGDTTKLGKAIADSEKQSKSLQGELKQVEKLLKFDPGNTELLAQKQKILTEAVNETTDKLEILRKAEEQVVEQFNRGDIGEDQLRAFQREIIKTQSELDGFQSALSALNNTISDTGGDIKQTSSKFDDLTEEIDRQEKELSELRDEYVKLVVDQGKNSKEAKSLASKMKDLNDDLADNKKKLADAENKADQFSDALGNVGDSADQSSGGFTIMKGALADLTANAISGAISKIGDFIGSLMELSEATEEYRTMQAKLEGASETFGYSVDFTKGKYEEFYKYLGDDQAATNAITNLMGLGTSTENISSIAEGAIGVWASYGDSIPIESLTESINETVNAGKVTGTFADTINWAKDSQEQLGKALGGNKTAQKAYNEALKEGLPVEDAFNEALAKITDEQERADVVAKFLNSTYGESKKAYDELNGSVMDANEAELALKDTQADLGETMAPVNTAITDLKNKALEAIIPLVEKCANGFLDLLNWLKEHPTAVKVLTAVVIALATAFTILAGALAIQGIITGVTKAIAFLNTTLLANPIVLIIAAIAALVAAFIYLWNNCDGFRNFWIGLWDKIKSVASTVKDALVEFFTVTIPNAWEKFKTKSSETITAVVEFFKQLPSKIWNAIQNAIERVVTWGNNLKAKATNIAKNVVNSVVNFFKELPYKIGYAIGFVIGKLVSWGASMLSWVKTNVPKIINSVVNFFKQLPGKIWTWLQNTISKVTTWASNMKQKATSAATNFVNAVVTFVKQLPGKVWTWLVNTVNRVSTWASNMASKAKTAATNFVNSVVNFIKQLPSKIQTWLSNTISKVASWGSSLASKGKAAAKQLLDAVVNTAKQIPSKMLSIGKDIVSGVWNGIKGAAGTFTKNVKSFFSGIVDGAKSALGINSPSKVFANVVGKAIPEGIAKGVVDNVGLAKTSVENLADDLSNQAVNINGATINRQLTTAFTADSVGAAGNNGALMDKLDRIYNRLNQLQIVLDTGTLVGETIDKIDAELATRQLLSARGV